MENNVEDIVPGKKQSLEKKKKKQKQKSLPVRQLHPTRSRGTCETLLDSEEEMCRGAADPIQALTRCY
jgi:hypothetical protein